MRNRKRIPEGIFTVTLEVTDDMGLQDTYRATMEVGRRAAGPIAYTRPLNRINNARIGSRCPDYWVSKRKEYAEHGAEQGVLIESERKRGDSHRSNCGKETIFLHSSKIAGIETRISFT